MSSEPRRRGAGLVRLFAIGHPLGPCMARAVGAAEYLSSRFHAVTDHAAPAMCARWSQLVDRAFEAVERVGAGAGAHLERLVVLVAAHVTTGHGMLRSRKKN